jgi:hypothetical protein
MYDGALRAVKKLYIRLCAARDTGIGKHGDDISQQSRLESLKASHHELYPPIVLNKLIDGHIAFLGLPMHIQNNHLPNQSVNFTSLHSYIRRYALSSSCVGNAGYRDSLGCWQHAGRNISVSPYPSRIRHIGGGQLY